MNIFLKGQPWIDYICVYGRRTLQVPDADLTGSKSPNWQSHDDTRKELESIEAGER